MPSQSRIKCIAEDCPNMILPATAKTHDGFCAPCSQKLANEKMDKYVRENRREVDPYAGLTDPVEIIRVFHTRRKYDPLVHYRDAPKSVEELYRELKKEDAERLMDLASVALIRGEKDFAEDIAKFLAMLTDFPRDRMLATWVAQAEFWPPIIFRDADAEIRDGVIEAINNGAGSFHLALRALAWIGDEVVEREFRRRDSEALWRLSQLQVSPSENSKVAGWELTENERRDLFYKTCFGIKPAQGASDKAMKVMEETDSNCPWCRRSLVNLIELDLRDYRFQFLKVQVAKLPVLTCDACTCFGVVFGSVGQDGKATWAKENQRPKYLPDDRGPGDPSPWRGVPISLQARRPVEAADWSLESSLSQVGGLPGWVQDHAYPNCPDCKHTMMFLAQLDEGAFPYNEGVYYAFLCPTCLMTATTYQQT